MKQLVYLNNHLYNLYSIIFIYLIGAYCLLKQLLFNWYMRRNVQGYKPEKHDGVCIVTGGCQGIGAELAQYLVKAGMHVIVASPEPNKMLKEFQQHEDENNGKVEYQQLDLSSMMSVKRFAENFLSREMPLHLLVNNAGVMFGSYKLTEDGFEYQMAVNYYGHFLLTYLLLPLLAKSGTSYKQSRIINLTSSCHYAGSIDLDDLNSKKFYSAFGCYAQSKLAIVMATKLLQKYLKEKGENVSVNAVHPGVVNTKLYVNSLLGMVPYFIKNGLFMSPQKAAEDLGYICLSREMEGVGGMYFENCCPIQPNQLSNNEQLQLQLWTSTCKLLGLKTFENFKN